MVRQWQELFNESRYSSTCLMNCKRDPSECKGTEKDCILFIPDFVKVAEAYNAKGIRVEKKEDLDKAFQEALKNKNGPFVIDVMTEREENVWPMVPGGASLNEMLKGGMTV
jgi:acetolactate synthase-1/2/3 large subunit